MKAQGAFLEAIERHAGDPARALELTVERFEADTGALHRLGPDGMLHLQAAVRIPEPLLPVIETIPVGKGIAGLTVERREPVDLCNLQTDQSGQARPGARDTGVKGSICVPLWAGGEVVGALGIGTVRERRFEPEEIELLVEAGRRLAEAGASTLAEKQN